MLLLNVNAWCKVAGNGSDIVWVRGREEREGEGRGMAVSSQLQLENARLS